MSDMKCPFCQQELKIAGEHTTIMSCFNGDCKGSGLYGEKAFWQELIRTRKALETLQEFVTKLYLNGNITDEQLERYKKILITALEQKEAK